MVRRDGFSKADWRFGGRYIIGFCEFSRHSLSLSPPHAFSFSDNLLGVAHDITERKRAEEQSHRNTARLQTKADALSVFAENRPEQEGLILSLNDVAKICAGHIGDTCVITLLSEDGEWLDPVAFYNPDNKALEFAKIILPNSAYRLGQDLVSQTIRSRQPLLIPIIPQEKI